MKRSTYDDAHYCSCINKYLHSKATCLCDIRFYVCINDKHKISIGQTEYTLSALPRCKHVLVAKKEL